MLNPNQSYVLYQYIPETLSEQDLQKVLLAVIEHLKLRVVVQTDYTGAVAHVEVESET